MFGYVNVDICPPADQIADLNERWPWGDGTADEIRAFDIIEHLPNRIHTMNEAWRVLKRGGKFEISVPTTDGRGADQDPTHVSRWNRNSFFYYTQWHDYRARVARPYGIKATFKIVSEKEEQLPGDVVVLHIILEAVKRAPDQPTVELAFFAKNRVEFTEESWCRLRQNTNWDLVDKIVFYDDGSTDGTLQFLQRQAQAMGAELRQTNFGSGLTARTDFFRRATCELLATVDNDAMYPPGWLEIGLELMGRKSELQYLCLENYFGLKGPLPYTYRQSRTGDGLAIIRRSIFRGDDVPIAQDTYHGLDDWMIKHKIVVGWLKPAINVFLLDRVPLEPWCSISEKYVKNGWQRKLEGQPGVHRYTDAESYLWSWCKWEPQAVVAPKAESKPGLPNVSICTMTKYHEIFEQFDKSRAQFEPQWKDRVVAVDGNPNVRAEAWKVLKGETPFVFAANWNAAIQAADQNSDILITNDDVQFIGPGGIAKLRAAAYSDPAIGIISPQIRGLVGNPLQSAQTKLNGLTISKDGLAFVCIYIKRSCWNAVGPMDEQFHGYGSDDLDYCLRAQKAGLKLAVTPDVVVRHAHGKYQCSATFERSIGKGELVRSMGEMHKLLDQKWNIPNAPAPPPKPRSKEGITVLTPTGGRPEAFRNLEQFMARQTFKGDIQWLCADDVAPATEFTMDQIVARPLPLWQPGQNTQCRNMLALLDRVRFDKILICEDDDWIAPNYLELMAGYLENAALVGEKCAIYYNVQSRSWLDCRNERHASLCQTGFRAELLPMFHKICTVNPGFVDMMLWSEAKQNRISFGLHPATNACIGMKGMPGRGGIGVGHKPQGPRWKSDPDLETLRGWMGDDADLYESFWVRERDQTAPHRPSLSGGAHADLSLLSGTPNSQEAPRL
jgi:hypothetical protein